MSEIHRCERAARDSGSEATCEATRYARGTARILNLVQFFFLRALSGSMSTSKFSTKFVPFLFFFQFRPFSIL